MRKRYFVVAALFASLASVGFVAALLMSNGPNGPGVTKANFDRIKEGMTRKEVEELFGQKEKIRFQIGQVHLLTWQASDGSRAVIEFVDDRAIPSEWINSDETFLDKIRRWLRLR